MFDVAHWTAVCVCASLTCLHCSQRVIGAVRWLSTHWRAAKVLCLDFQAFPAGKDHPAQNDWEAAQPAPACPAGCVRVLRVTCSRYTILSVLRKRSQLRVVSNKCWDGIARWVAAFVPLCQYLTILHLRRVELEELPALPLLKHLILEDLLVQPVLVASLQGLASLETLHVRGMTPNDAPWTAWEWDVTACTRLRRVFVSANIAKRLAAAGGALYLPPACTAALQVLNSEQVLQWVVRLGRRVRELHVYDDRLDTAAMRLVCAPQLLQLRHIAIYVGPVWYSGMSMAPLFSALPGRVESLHLHYAGGLPSEHAVVVVPASLRALRVKAVFCTGMQGQNEKVFFGLHAGLERLCLMLWDLHVDLQCLDAGAPTCLREMVVQARAVVMDSHLLAEVGQRGRMLQRCDVVDWEWAPQGYAVPTVQVVHIGQGPVHMEYKRPLGRVWHWPCTCGSCAECLGSEAFGGVVDARG